MEVDLEAVFVVFALFVDKENISLREFSHNTTSLSFEA
jgi:hypothetical protein